MRNIGDPFKPEVILKDDFCSVNSGQKDLKGLKGMNAPDNL